MFVFSTFVYFFPPYCYFFHIVQLLNTLAEERTKCGASPLLTNCELHASNYSEVFWQIWIKKVINSASFSPEIYRVLGLSSTVQTSYHYSQIVNVCFRIREIKHFISFLWRCKLFSVETNRGWTWESSSRVDTFFVLTKGVHSMTDRLIGTLRHPIDEWLGIGKFRKFRDNCGCCETPRMCIQMLGCCTF